MARAKLNRRIAPDGPQQGPCLARANHEGDILKFIELAHNCVAVTPSLVPKRAGDRVKTNRRDSVSLQTRIH
ncbi:hypothetical protein FHT76_006972 [Rhizobium sp. BK176]|nr:hypothetical protein [Rhizobium sp. BK181]MBB3543374.1 hypothetical protein [Rhizobium sp. BK399]MCS3743570.1 hypothetical protein [Rhizobium sp. BK661]MCS4095262.1 hypothetical protein [Rhizobium sp. BK176]